MLFYTYHACHPTDGDRSKLYDNRGNLTWHGALNWHRTDPGERLYRQRYRFRAFNLAVSGYCPPARALLCAYGLFYMTCARCGLQVISSKVGSKPTSRSSITSSISLQQPDYQMALRVSYREPSRVIFVYASDKSCTNACTRRNPSEDTGDTRRKAAHLNCRHITHLRIY